MKTKLIFALAIAIPGAVAAQSTAHQKPKPDKKVCRSEVPTGSIMAKSTCHTRAEWDAIDATNQADAQSNLDRHSRVGGQYGG